MLITLLHFLVSIKAKLLLFSLSRLVHVVNPRRTLTLPDTSIFLFLIFMLPGLSACDRQQEPRIVTIGVINYSPAAEPGYDGFRQGMAKLGYEEGRTIQYLYKGYINDKQKLTVEGRRLMAQKVDLIFSMSTPASLVAKEVTAGTDIPVVFGPVSNPVNSGIVASLKHPGGNVTGVTFSQQEPKRLEFLKILKPTIKRVCFPYNSKDKSPVLNLPHLTGGELAKKILAIRADIPIILSTGFSAKFTEELAQKIGIREYLMKPVILQELTEKIRAALGKG